MICTQIWDSGFILCCLYWHIMLQVNYFCNQWEMTIQLFRSLRHHLENILLHGIIPESHYWFKSLDILSHYLPIANGGFWPSDLTSLGATNRLSTLCYAGLCSMHASTPCLACSDSNNLFSCVLSEEESYL